MSNILSVFQMLLCKTDSFKFNMPLDFDPANVQFCHRFAGSYSLQYDENNCWLGVITMLYASSSDKDFDVSPEHFHLEITMSGRYEFHGENTEESKAKFESLLRMNGALGILTIMRGQVGAATTVLGMSPCLIMPNINLNNFKWMNDIKDTEPEK